MKSAKPIYLFWWSAKRLEGKPKENFGDILSKYLVERISGKPVIWRKPSEARWNPFRKKTFTVIGSILKHVTKDCIVWGSGIISSKDEVKEAQFLAVRGPETYAHLTSKGYKVNQVFGDPAILLPLHYEPNKSREYQFGIIPHYVDHELVSNWYENNEDVTVIDLLNDDVEDVVDQIVSCKQIISSSLHGLIVSHAYGIPAVWVQFSKKLSGDNIKFVDYFKSVNLQPYSADFMDRSYDLQELAEILNDKPTLPDSGVIEELGKKLMAVCPF